VSFIDLNMSTEFPYLKVPDELRSIVGEPTPGTRTYRREGTYEECGKWFEAISEHFEGVGLSPGGVSMFAPVSRAAVHKRLKDGKLTAFTFYVTRDEKSLFGTKRKAKQRPYILLSKDECKAWGAELKRRTGHEQPVEPDNEEAVESDKFVQQDPKDRGNRKVVYKEEPLTRDEIVGLVKAVVKDALIELLPAMLKKKGAKKKGWE